MKRSIRKTAAFIHVSYLDGDYSNNLSGSNFTVETSEAMICLSIDLTSNSNDHNKTLNCHQDVHDLIDKHNKLKFVQIDESQIIKGLLAVKEKYLNTVWQLKLIIGPKFLEYEIKPNLLNGSLLLNIN